MNKLKPIEPQDEPTAVEPLLREDYLERRKAAAEAYRESIGRYDQLVPWGAGGALLASMTFLEKIAPHPQAFTRWMLLAAWGALVFAVFASTASHYTSSRIFSWRVNLLDHRQRLPKDEAWKETWVRVSRRVKWWGKVTAILNPLAGLALVAGALLLASFAFYNAPFAPQP